MAKKISFVGWNSSTIKYGRDAVAKILPLAKNAPVEEFIRLVIAAPAMLEMLEILASSTAVLNHLNSNDNQDLCDLISRVKNQSENPPV